MTKLGAEEGNTYVCCRLPATSVLDTAMCTGGCALRRWLAKDGLSDLRKTSMLSGMQIQINGHFLGLKRYKGRDKDNQPSFLKLLFWAVRERAHSCGQGQSAWGSSGEGPHSCRQGLSDAIHSPIGFRKANNVRQLVAVGVQLTHFPHGLQGIWRRGWGSGPIGKS